MAVKPLKDRVLDEIPGYRAAEQRHDHLRAQMRITPAVSDMSRPYVDRISKAGDAGQDLDELRDEYAAEYQRWASDVEFNQLINYAREGALAAANSAKSVGTDYALDFLRDELDALMTDVASHRDILASRPVDAETAINAGGDGLKRWQIAEDLISRYAELRAEHLRYTFTGNPNAAGHRYFGVIGQIAGFLEAEPYWLRLRSTNSAEHSIDPAIATWLATKPGGEFHRTGIWPATISRAEWLLIVANNKPWLPDAEDIARLGDRAEQLFSGRHTYRNALDVRRFRDCITELTALGAVTTFGG